MNNLSNKTLYNIISHVFKNDYDINFKNLRLMKHPKVLKKSIKYT
jgi:hypothetical protein